MGTGHGRHSKRPDHGASPSHVADELRAALLALREVKKALARADTRFRQVPPATMNAEQWAWGMQVPIEAAAQQAAVLKATIDRALACVPGDGRTPPREIANDETAAVVPAADPVATVGEAAAHVTEEIHREVDEQIRRQRHRAGRVPKDF